MNLKEKIIEILQDFKRRTPQEIYKEIIDRKDYFFETVNPLSSIKVRCVKLYREKQIECEIYKDEVHYYIPLEREEIENMEKEEIENEEKKLVEFIEGIENMKRQIIEEKKNGRLRTATKRRENIKRTSIVIGVISFGICIFNYFLIGN